MTGLLLIVLLILLLTTTAAPEPLPPPQREAFNCTVDGSRWPYLLQTPPGEAQAVLVYLHGHYGDEGQGMTEGIYEDAFGKLRRECLRRQWAYVSTWYGGNSWMGPLGEAGLVDLIGVLRQKWPGKPVYLAGGSMGGSSTLVFALRRPELLAGIVAMCPAGNIADYYRFASQSSNPTLQNIAAAIKLHYTVEGRKLEEELAARSAATNAERFTMPVYLCHGSADALIPPDGVRALAAELQRLGRKVKYVEIPGGGHDAPVLGIDWGPVLDFVAGK